jgi:hypothetical protein
VTIRWSAAGHNNELRAKSQDPTWQTKEKRFYYFSFLKKNFKYFFFNNLLRGECQLALVSSISVVLLFKKKKKRILPAQR